jgi:hypothetical protein
MQLPQGQILIDKYLCALCPETGGVGGGGGGGGGFTLLHVAHGVC